MKIPVESYKSWQTRGVGPENLALAEAPIPPLGDFDLLVAIRAVSLNHRDKLIVDGVLPANPSVGYTPASDASGEVVATGSKVRRFAIGARVTLHAVTGWLEGRGPDALDVGMLSAGLPGVLRDYILISEEAAVPTPPPLTNEQAATLPIAALTAWSALFETGKFKPGQTVLIQGTGGVAIFALQFAASFGFKAIVTSSSDDKLARARELGAWQTINYRAVSDWDQTVLELTGGKGVDRVLELAGGDSLAKSIKALAVGGQLSLIGILGGVESVIPTPALLRKRLTIQGVAMGSRRAFERMNNAIEVKAIEPEIEAVYSFQDVPKAFQHLGRGPFGKIVISIP